MTLSAYLINSNVTLAHFKQYFQYITMSGGFRFSRAGGQAELARAANGVPRATTPGCESR